MPEGCWSHDSGMDTKIKNMADFRHITRMLKDYINSLKIQEKIDKAASYIMSNWDAAKYRLRRECGVEACSAEGHVYHLLLSRKSDKQWGGVSRVTLNIQI